MSTKRTKKTADAPAAETTTRRRGGTHQIRLVLDVPKTAPAAALAQLSPSQKEWTLEAQKSGDSTRLVIVFPASEHRDLDEAIRALPGGLQAGVVHASKLG